MDRNIKRIKNFIFIGLAFFFAGRCYSSESKMVLIPEGKYLPFFITKKSKDLKTESRKPVSVASFWMDQYPVTQEEFLFFTKKNSQWKKSKIKKIFSDQHYLENWTSDLKPPKGQQKSPVVFVSWFAAKAYCQFQGKKLPSVDQWEYVADDHGKGPNEAKQKILDWYAHPNSEKLPDVGNEKPNGYNVYNLYGLIWEWTLDFNSTLVSDESRASNSADNALFCGGGALGAADPSDYARFMRFSFRNSLKANYTIGNLGFRCVKDI